MEHLNYCRQIKQQMANLADIPSLEPEKKTLARHLHDLCCVSAKFMLPHNGIWLDDDEMRALPRGQRLRLPYEFVALEFPGEYSTARFKCVLFCAERDSGSIVVRPVFWSNSAGMWDVVCREFYLSGIDGEGESTACLAQTFESKPDSDGVYSYLSRVVASFLNALACSNVHVERKEPRNTGKKIKSAIPFDTYHILTVDVSGSVGGSGLAIGSHRSPREHLRRGHIRRLSDGRRIWVNATVVAAGKGGGVVKKDYALRCAA